jgi:predicted DNA-binding transcriptional regulator AlpA
MSRTTVWRLRKREQFPPPIKLSERRIAWRRADIEAWLEECKQAADA